MFPNKEPMKEINRSDVFAIMLQDLPWNALKICLQTNAQILKRCTMGGHRLEVKARRRMEKIFLQEVEKEDFPESLCHTVFAYWYPLQKELHEQLEEYFHSEEYKKYREENDLDENTYVLTDQKFDQFFAITDLQKWRVLLCFSPLQFTEEQAEKIVTDSQGNTELIESVETLEKEKEERDSTIARLNNELNSTRSRLEQLNTEVQQLRQEKRTLKAEISNTGKQAETAQKEKARLQSRIENSQNQLEQLQKESEEELLRKTNVLTDELERSSQELKNWQAKYEKQSNENRSLTEKLRKTENILAEERIGSDKNRKEIKRIHKFIDLLLERIDWAEVGRQIKLTPQLKLRFNSLIRNLHYDEENRPRIQVPIEKFWDNLQVEERKLIENIAQSDTYEVESGDVESFWQDLEDSFEDVQIGLETRTILIQIMHEIFYQTIDLKDLQKDTLPAAMTKTRKSN